MTTEASPSLTIGDEEAVRFLSTFWKVYRRIKGRMTALLQKRGLDLRLFLMLRAIQAGTAYPKALSEELQLPPTLVSRYLEQLLQRSLISRQIDEQDSRRTRLSLTEAGEAALKEIKAELQLLTAQDVQTVNPADFLAMLSTLDALAESPTLRREA